MSFVWVIRQNSNRNLKYAKMIKKICYYLFNKPANLGVAILVRLSAILPDKLYLKLMFRFKMGYWMDFDNPKTFNEKLQWLKLYNRKPEYTRMVDKFAVKEYVESIIGAEYIIPTLGVWNRFEDIDFETLPEKFVLKTTHGGGGGGIIICKNKALLDIGATKVRLSKSLKQNIYRTFKEWPYKNVPRKIIAEQYIADSEDGELKDYKFFCFNGRVEYYKIDFDRFVEHKANYFDRDGNLMRFGEEVCPPDYNKRLEMPQQISKMIILAEKLSQNLPFARIDLYCTDNKVYFGEITFFPAGGFGKFTPSNWDAILGDLIYTKKRNE